MWKRKLPFFLLEILIGLSLISLLFSFLFSAFRQTIEWNEKAEKARISLLEREHCSARLQNFFLSLTNSSLYTEELPGEKTKGLIATIDHGLDIDPLFSGTVLAKIHLQADQKLTLTLWPLETEKKHKPWRTETLLSGVEKVEWRFTHKNLLEKETCAKDAQEEPLIIRLRIWQKEQPIDFAFFPLYPEPIATYGGSH